MKRLIPTLLALLTALLFASTASAQDPCDANPDDPSCGIAITATPAPPEVCPYGGTMIAEIGIVACNGAPGAAGAPGATGPQGGQGLPGTPGGPSFIPSATQAPSCTSRRMFDVTIPQRFPWGARVWVIVGGRLQLVQVRHNHRIRVALQGRPCGLYAVVVRKKGIRAWSHLYVAGLGGNVTGINLR